MALRENFMPASLGHVQGDGNTSSRRRPYPEVPKTPSALLGDVSRVSDSNEGSRKTRLQLLPMSRPVAQHSVTLGYLGFGECQSTHPLLVAIPHSECDMSRRRVCRSRVPGTGPRQGAAGCELRVRTPSCGVIPKSEQGQDFSWVSPFVYES